MNEGKILNIIGASIILVFVLFVLGCGGGSNDKSSEPEDNSTSSLALNLKYKTAFDYGYSVTKVTSKITKGEFSKEIDLTIDGANQTATGNYDKLGIGEYSIKIKVYNGETQIAEGTGTAIIGKNKIVSVEIAIEYFTGALTINFYLDDGRARIFGLKSCGSSSPGYCGAGIVKGSLAPTNLFSFRADRSDFVEIGSLTLDNNNIDADALAISPTYGLLAFKLEKSGFTTISSTLISIDYKTAIASIIGSKLDGFDIRGAVFDRSEKLWVLDATGNQLVNIDPTTGAVIGTPVTLMLNGSIHDLSDVSDIAVTTDDVFVVTDSSGFYSLDISSGILVLVNSDSGQGLTGATFSNFASQNAIFTYEVNGFDDIYRYEIYFSSNSTTVHENIINQFNSGRGDLASLLSFSETQP